MCFFFKFQFWGFGGLQLGRPPPPPPPGVPLWSTLKCSKQRSVTSHVGDLCTLCQLKFLCCPRWSLGMHPIACDPIIMHSRCEPSENNVKNTFYHRDISMTASPNSIRQIIQTNDIFLDSFQNSVRCRLSTCTWFYHGCIQARTQNFSLSVCVCVCGGGGGGVLTVRLHTIYVWF
jgi:hypothetical protein